MRRLGEQGTRKNADARLEKYHGLKRRRVGNDFTRLSYF